MRLQVIPGGLSDDLNARIQAAINEIYRDSVERYPDDDARWHFAVEVASIQYGKELEEYCGTHTR